MCDALHCLIPQGPRDPGLTLPGQGLRYLEHVCQMLERIAQLQKANLRLQQQQAVMESRLRSQEPKHVRMPVALEGGESARASPGQGVQCLGPLCWQQGPQDRCLLLPLGLVTSAWREEGEMSLPVWLVSPCCWDALGGEWRWGGFLAAWCFLGML